LCVIDEVADLRGSEMNSVHFSLVLENFFAAEWMDYMSLLVQVY
jgi:hypothetical protein